jgi:UDP-glucose 4-epimerase
MASKVVLITGVADNWGWRLAKRLANESGIALLGLDSDLPEKEIQNLDFIRTDVRNPALGELFRSEQVHTVCHLKFIHRVRPSTAVSELNVVGTQKVLGACVEAGVRQVVLKSSLGVYGAHPNNSGLLTESHSLRGSRRYGYTRHLLDIEAICEAFRRQTTDLALTIMRCASIVGPTADTPMTRFLRNPWSPTLLGFDPMLQILHEDDVVEVLAHAVLSGRPGIFNIAADGPMPLSQILALAGTIQLPIFHPLAYWGIRQLNRSKWEMDRYVPIELDYLRYSWVGDVTRMYDELEFAPSFTAKETLREFAERRHPSQGVAHASALEMDQIRLQATIERRRRLREQSATSAWEGEEDE